MNSFLVDFLLKKYKVVEVIQINVNNLPTIMFVSYFKAAVDIINSENFYVTYSERIVHLS